MIDTVQAVCDALGLEFYIGPPRGAAPAPARSQGNQPLASVRHGLEPVSDRRLAELLALFADEWESCGEAGRGKLEARFRAYFPELAGGAQVRRVVAWLGWRVIGSGGAGKKV